MAETAINVFGPPEGGTMPPDGRRCIEPPHGDDPEVVFHMNSAPIATLPSEWYCLDCGRSTSRAEA